MLGTTLAGLAGVAGAPIFNSLTTGTYLFVLLAATAAAVLGGFRSVPLAALGGLIIGAVQSLVAGYANFAQSIPGFSDAVPFALLFVGLVFWGRERAPGRPSGRGRPAPGLSGLRAPVAPGRALDLLVRGDLRLHPLRGGRVLARVWPPRASLSPSSSSFSPSSPAALVDLAQAAFWPPAPG